VTELRSNDSEEGFTLIELVISIGVLALIIVPIVGSMLFGLVQSSGMRERINDSSGAQLISSYFPSDIQSAGSDAGTGIALSGNGNCTTVPGSATVQLRITIPDATLATSAAPATKTAHETTVLYYTQPDPTGALKLTRQACRTTPTMDTSTVVVPHLDSTPGFSPVCTPTLAACTRVTVTFKAFNPKATSTGYAGKTYVLNGTRRITS
jgi:type II secretory pathway pseudopilin PulG